MKFNLYILLIIFTLTFKVQAQHFKGVVKDELGATIPGVLLKNYTTNHIVVSDGNGLFTIPASLGDSVHFRFSGYKDLRFKLKGNQIDTLVPIMLFVFSKDLKTVNIYRKKLEHFDVGFMPMIKGTQITTGTNAVIELENLSGAKSTANPREMLAKIPGLNIWESDGAGIQIGIGGRGLSPNRAANFNTRQNGYDISADALVYPESYYTPPFEALKSIEIIRGSAALQFGTQFGGLLNFNIKDAPTNTPLEITSRGPLGNYGYKGIFNRVAGTTNKFFYQAYHQYKEGTGYRANANFNQHQFFAQAGYYILENWKVRLEYTQMNYLAQQPGGLTDLQFQQDPRKSYRNRNWFKVGWNMLAFHSDYEISTKATINVRAFGMKSTRESTGFLGKINQADPLGNRDLIQGLFQNGGIEGRYLQRYDLKKGDTSKAMSGAFLVGARYYRGHTTNNQGLVSAGSNADFSYLHPTDLENSSYDFPSENASLFSENILFLSSKLTMNFGVRYEYITSEANGFYKRYNVHPYSKDTLAIYKLYDSNRVVRNVPLFGFGLNYKLNGLRNVYANYTQNYRAINFTDIRVANPNILVDTLMKDEKGYTMELGYRGLVKDYLTFDIAIFNVFYGNKIGIAPKANSIFKERTNIGDAMNLGIEAFGELDVIGLFKDSAKHNLNVFLNAAYIDARYIRSKEPNFVGNKVEYVSPVVVKSGLKWKWSKMTTQLQISYNSPQFSDATNSIEPSGDAVIGQVPAYTVIDLSSKYQINKQFQVELGINNLTNQSYYTRRATAYPGPGILPSDGISAYFTLQYKFALNAK